MRLTILALALAAPAVSSSALADGMLIPRDRSLPPLGLARQEVRVVIDVDGQVADTTVVQVFRNTTGRDLEADYLFPLPPGASVRQFTMWVGGKRMGAETLGAREARDIYEGIVRRLEDPGLLEYIDRDLCKVRIYPVPRRGEQKVEVRFTAVLPRVGDMVSYEYPLRAGQAPKGEAIGSFALDVTLKGRDTIGPIYSPSHDLAIRRGDREATARFERSGYSPTGDFRLFFAPKTEGVGLSLLTRREEADGRGYFLLLLSPRADEAEERPIPRDLVVALDASGSMDEEKLRQAKGAVRYALGTLGAGDRFALVRYATTVTPFREGLVEASPRHLASARAWVEAIEAEGGTDIASALEAAQALRRGSGEGRSFQVLLLTDGRPTVGRIDPGEILEATKGKAGRGTRIFTFGVGDDVDAHLLDQVAEATRAASTYVRPSEDLEVKASALMAKIRHPVRTDLRLKVGAGVRLIEMYPPRLPDLFRGEQVQVVGRFEGSGRVLLTLGSRLGDRLLEESHRVDFRADPAGPDFIAPIWARRKVGYLLDEIRLNGESDELKGEVTELARRFGIATPYTSLLVVPDEGPLARGPNERPRGRGRAAPRRRPGQGMSGGSGFGAGFGGGGGGMGMAGGMAGMGGGMGGMDRGMGGMGGGMTGGGMMGGGMGGMGGGMGGTGGGARAGSGGGMTTARSGKSAIDLAQRLAALKEGDRPETSADVRTVAGVRFQRAGDVWVDDRFDPSARTLILRPLGAGYFRLLERHPGLKDILALGRRVVWVSPSGTVLVLDTNGRDKVSDEALDRLFDTKVKSAAPRGRAG
jgi:Ca-activated chloride channel family protein